MKSILCGREELTLLGREPLSWLGREDSNLRSGSQSPAPYHLATPHHVPIIKEKAAAGFGDYLFGCLGDLLLRDEFRFFNGRRDFRPFFLAALKLL